MPLNLRQYNLKPNSNYNVSITIKKGDRIIDGLRSVYVSTPKYLTTALENTSTTSTIIFDRSYTRHTEKEPSVTITLPTPGKSATTEIIPLKIKKVTCNFSRDSKQYITQGAGSYAIKRLAVDIPRTVRFNLVAERNYSGSASISSSNSLLRSMNRPVVVDSKELNEGYFEIILSAKEIDPSLTWTKLNSHKNGGYWASSGTFPALKNGIDTYNNSTEVSDTWLNIQKFHPEVKATAGSTVQNAGVYVNAQGLTQTLKTSINNQDLISQLYWDDVGETDAIRDVVYFFFRDDTGDVTNANLLSEWIYLDEYFVSASPIPSGVNFKSNSYIKATGNKLSASVPAMQEKYLQLSEPEISLSKNVYQTIDQYENLATPTQVKVAFTIARYVKNNVTQAWAGTWLKTSTNATYPGYPVLSTPEILSGSS
jgi:hypothetical protein